MDISIVIPAYNEEGNIKSLYSSIKKVLDPLKKKYEVIFIDDGSNDRTFDEIRKLKKKHKNIRGYKFNINWGKGYALNFGFRKAMGSIIITMDADLQDDPIEIPRFLKKIEEDYDVVSGWKQSRKDSLAKRITSKAFNILTSLVVGLKLHDYNCGFKAYTRKAAKNIEIYGELYRYIPAIAYWKGFKVTEIRVNHQKRRYGKSKYGLDRLYKGFFDLLTVRFLKTFKRSPLHFFGVIGGLSIFSGVVIGIYLLYLRFILDMKIGDRPILMLAVLLIVIGGQFISMGLLGELIVRTHRKDEIVIAKKI